VTAETKTVEFHVPVPDLRTFRRLDADKLDPNVREKLEIEEGRADYVDGGLPRSFEITEEIMEFTTGAAVVSEEGEILAEFEGADAASRAERAMSTARVTYQMDFETEDAVKPKRASRAIVVNTDGVAEENIPF